MRHVIETTTIKEEDVTFYSSYFVVTTLTVVTLVPGPGSLTPSHFLCGYRLLTLPDTNAKENEADPDYIPSEISTKALTKRAQYQKTLINAFWTRWKTEYLTSLREHHTCRKRILNKKAVAIGDVVLIHDTTPRNQWKIGVVTSLHTGKDGLARSVSLRVPSGKELSRPIEKLYP